MKSRTESSVQNIVYSIVGQTVALLVSFILRIIFVRVLQKDYLGVDSLFTSLVSVLSLAELGVGSAINFSLYDPLAKKDTYRIKSLMGLYKKAYICIGIIIFIVGCMVTPFIEQISNTKGNVPNLKLLFLLFVLNSSISYFYSYKKSLIIADQYRYITVIYNYAFFVIMSVLQGIGLIVFKNYIFYLVTMILFTFLQNYFISKKADKMYPFLLDKKTDKVSKKTFRQIVKNAYAMSLHKLGGVVVNSTDSVIITHFSGIGEVGKYSNYLLITNALNLVFSQMFTSIIASVGNLNVMKSKREVVDVFYTVFFAGFWVVSFVSCCLIMFFNPFISLWVGAKFKFSFVIVVVIVVNFYVYQIRRPVLTFRDAMGVYWFDRYLPIIESLLNLTLSIYLASKIGVAGALLGTIFSTILTTLWVEPYILFKHGLHANVWMYYLKLGIFSLLAFVDIFLTRVISIMFSQFISNEILSFVVLVIISVLVFNLLFICFFFKFRDFQSMIKLLLLVKNMIFSRMHREKGEL